MRSSLIEKLTISNKKVYKKSHNCKGNLFVIQSNDIFMVTTIMRISYAIAKTLNYNVIVLPSILAKKDVLSLIESYSPFKILNTKILIIKSFLLNYKFIFNSLLALNNGRELESFKINGDNIGKHIYDSLLKRLRLPTIKQLSLYHKMLICFELSYYFSIVSLVKSKFIDFAILTDNVYRHGVFFEIFKAKGIPSVSGICVNNFSMHRYDTNEDYEDHCRTPDYEVIDKIYNSNELYLRAKKYLDYRFSGMEKQHDLIRAYSKSKRTISRLELIKEYKLCESKKIVLVMAHIFCDAPHADSGMLFYDYVEWLEETCIRLKKNRFVNILIKEHPSVELYGEKGVINKILSRNGLQNHLLSKDINTKSLFNCIDVLVTCGGTGGAEFPCFGVPVVVAAKPPYSFFPFIYKSDDKYKYLRLIDQIHKIKKLNLENVKLAECNMYVMYEIMKVDKSKIGFTNHIFSADHEIDYELYINQIIEDNNDKSMTNDFYKLMNDFMNSKYKNLINNNLLE